MFELHELVTKKIKNLYIFPIKNYEFAGVCFLDNKKFCLFSLVHIQSHDDFAFSWEARLNICGDIDCNKNRYLLRNNKVTMHEICKEIKDELSLHRDLICEDHKDSSALFCSSGCDKNEDIDKNIIIAKMIDYIKHEQ